MNYYDQNDHVGRRWGAAAVAFYAALCVGVMFVTYELSLPEPELGILVDFGTGDTGLGEEDLSPGDARVRPEPSPQQEQPVLTTDQEDAPPVVAPPPQPQPRPQPLAPQPQPVQPEPEPQRQVDQRALFPGRTEGSSSASQGTAGGEGNQGAREGSPGGSDSTGGSGSTGFSLDGRYVVGSLPRPSYDVQAEGRVVISINVNAAGVVTSAAYRQAGSTTNNGALVSAARSAALRARFTPAEADVQTGTITYVFRLN